MNTTDDQQGSSGDTTQINIGNTQQPARRGLKGQSTMAVVNGQEQMTRVASGRNKHKQTALGPRSVINMPINSLFMMGAFQQQQEAGVEKSAAEVEQMKKNPKDMTSSEIHDKYQNHSSRQKKNNASAATNQEERKG